MKRSLTLPLLAAVLVVAGLACDSANPVAPSGTILIISASPTQIGLNDTSTITVTGRRPNGDPLARGTEIRFSTNLGTIEGIVGVDGNGVAVATLRGDGRSGTATVTASTGSGTSSGGGDGEGGTTSGAVSATIDVQIGSSDETKPSLTVSASPNTLFVGQTSQITVVARLPDGSPVPAGQEVILTTTLGSLSPERPVTGSDGTAVATLSSGTQAGTATITAILGASDPATTEVTIETEPSLIISATPDTIFVGQTSEITVIARNPDGSPVAAGQTVILTTSLGSLSPSRPQTGADGTATTTLSAGTQAGTATITGVLGSSEPVTTEVTIRDIASSISLVANPETIADEDSMITLTAVVSNAQGLGIQQVLVSFSASTGALSSSTDFTDTNGIASVTLTVEAGDIKSGDEIMVTASTAGLDGTTLSDDLVITVQ